MDRTLYQAGMQEALRATPNLTLIESSVSDLSLSNSGKLKGITTTTGEIITAPKVVLTTGTFLNGTIYIGTEKFPAGRRRREGGLEPPSIGLAETLQNLNFPLSRLKTGTPPRLDGTTIDYTRTFCHYLSIFLTLYHHILSRFGSST